MFNRIATPLLNSSKLLEILQPKNASVFFNLNVISTILQFLSISHHCPIKIFWPFALAIWVPCIYACPTMHLFESSVDWNTLVRFFLNLGQRYSVRIKKKTGKNRILSKISKLSKVDPKWAQNGGVFLHFLKNFVISFSWK